MKNKSLVKLFALLSLIGFALCGVGGSVVGTFINSSVNEVSAFQDKDEFYSKKGFDLIVKGPSADQIEGFKVRDDVTSCTPYLEVDLNSVVKGKNSQSTVLVFDSVADLTYSENTSVRLIESKEGLSNPIFIDYKFAKYNGLNLADKVTLFVDGNAKECSVSRIFKTDFIFTGGVIFTTTEVVPATLKTSVYLSSNNKESLVAALKDYKPMGTFLEKTEYQTDEQYQQYVEEFYAKDYSTTHVLDYHEAEQANKESGLAQASSAKTAVIVASSVFGALALALSLSGFFVVAKSKKDYLYKHIHDNGPKVPMQGYSIFHGVMAVTSTLTMILSVAISASQTASFYTFGAAFLANIWALLIPLVCIHVGYIVTMIKLKKA